MTWKTALIRHKNYLSKGMGEFGAIRYLTYLIGVTGALTSALSFDFIVMMGLAYVGSSYVFGCIWDYLKLYQEEAEFGNQRNLFVQEMRDMEGRLRTLYKSKR